MANEIVHSSPVSEQLPSSSSSSSTRKFFKVLFARNLVIIGMFIILMIIVAAALAPLIAPYDPYEQDLSKSLQNPSSEHLLGTDLVGRDILSRIIYGSRTSLLVGVGAAIVGGAIGTIIGLIAGYFGGLIDSLIMRIMDGIMAIPMIVMALALGAAMGGGLLNVIISLGIALIPSYARQMRGQVRTLRNSDYIISGEIMGMSNLRNMFVHVLPNCLSPMIVLTTLNFGLAILAEAALSFLGLGIRPPGAAWGAMISDGYQYLRSNPILSFAPGIAVVLTVLALNIVGDALRDALDPRLRGRT